MTEHFFLALAFLALACRESKRIQHPVPVPKAEKQVHLVSRNDARQRHKAAQAKQQRHQKRD